MIINTGQRTDIPAFCAKKPAPMFPYRDLLKNFGQYWFMIRKNFPEAREVSLNDRLMIGKGIIKIAAECGMPVKPCAEGDLLAVYGADCSGCMKVSDYE